MKIMLDVSPAKLASQSAKFCYDFWQLRTPLTQNKIGTVPYALDNGCYKIFHRSRWEKMLEDAEKVRPIFVCMPDCVGDAQRTIELFDYFKARTNGLPRALVLQDGIENVRIPWDDIDAVFIGGTDSFKTSPVTFRAAHTAKMLGKWVHVGRVNTFERVNQWIGKADSLDGSGISRFDHMLENVLAAIRGDRRNQLSLIGTPPLD